MNSGAWLTAMLDVPAGVVETEARFWCQITDWRLSPWREQTFATFEPGEGDPHLRIQRTSDRLGVHLDWHTADPRAAAARAEELGATLVADRGFLVLSSPGGLPFCCVSPRERIAPPATRWGSRLDTVCLDVDPADRDRELQFWSALTGWPLLPDLIPGQYAYLDSPRELPFRLLVQTRQAASGAVSAHLDLATVDRQAEVARHLQLGAQVDSSGDWWTVLRDPAGLAYCVVDQRP